MSNSSKPEAYPQLGVASTCRSYVEYETMFCLQDVDWSGQTVLDVAGGASSFSAQAAEKGAISFAVDPFYSGLTEAVIEAAGKEIEVSTGKIIANATAFDWSFYRSPEHHRAMREQSLQIFAADFRRDVSRERYIAAALPALPFEAGTFSLILCSHFLFLYAAAFDEAFHEAAICELLRLLKPGGELRIYPLVSLQWEESPYLPALLERLKDVADAEFFPTQLPFTPISSPVLRMVKREED